jgi:hypothetical protein
VIRVTANPFTGVQHFLCYLGKTKETNMNRSTLDKLISTTGLIVAVVLLCASGALFYAHDFVHNQVRTQLSAEVIYFPAAGSASLTALPSADQKAMSKYAGQQMLTGAEAETWADHYIAVHLQKIGGGKTYAQLSAESMANPTNQVLAKQVQTVFQGETLRGMLLNAYAFDTMAVVAYYAAIGALAAGIVLLILSVLGFLHAGVVVRKTRRR